MKIVTFTLCAGALMALGRVAAAEPPRYLVCHEERDTADVRAPERERQSEDDDWAPLPRKRPRRLQMAKLEIFDVPESDPMPSRRSGQKRNAPVAVQVPVASVESRNTWRCIGVPRGTPGMVRVIAAPPGARFFGHPYLESWRQDNMQAAGQLGVTAARAELRRVLERPLPQHAEAWQLGELRRSKHTAARALADLGDSASARLVLELLRSAERDGFHLWRDSLDSLSRLDPALAQRYALELIARALEKPELLRQNPTLYTDLLPLVVTPSDQALAVLQRASGMLTKDDVALPHGSGGCQLLAARIRLGDAALTAELRAELSTASLSTQRSVQCYSALMPDLYPGRDASELDVLMHRHRYDSILAWLQRTRADSSDAIQAPRRRLRAWLEKRSREPDVAGDRSHRSFVPDLRAKHLAALSVLGDARAQQALVALATDRDDDGTAPWVAVWFALKLDLPKARDLAAQRLLVARQKTTRRFSSSPWPKRGALIITEHGRVVEELARRGDERFVLGLLDRDAFTRQLTTTLLARKPVGSACETVGVAAGGATSEAVDHAFWALSLLGDQCRETMRRLAQDPKEPRAVRGMANEHLAMLRDSSVPQISASQSRLQGYRATVWRARVILAAPE